MIKSNLHTHTLFCDGKEPAEAMVKAAIALGYDTLGFSVHAFTPFDTGYCVKDERAYSEEIDRLKAKYAGKITLLKGAELDYYGALPTFDTDFTIGSVHYVKAGGEYAPVDLDKQTLVGAVDKHFGGDMYALIAEYLDGYVKMINALKPTIAGHFDLYNKYNADGALFDKSSPRYIKLIESACDSLKGANSIIEINVGNMIKNAAPTPYPDYDIIKLLNKRGFSFCLSLDAHDIKALAFNCSDVVKNIKAAGVTSLATWKDGKLAFENI